MKYSKQVYLGYDASGRQVRKWFYADSKTELKQKIEQYKEELRKVSNPSEVTFRDYSAHWMSVYKSTKAKQTRDMYQNALNKCGTLNPVPVKRITKSMLQEVINKSWSHPSAAEDLASTLNQIFKAAIADGIIATNPATTLSLPKKPQSRFYLLTKEDLEKVKNADLCESDRLFVSILQVFGLRPAEALALQPNDFDWKAGVLHITKSLELSNDNKSRIKSTKTEAVRDIPIPEELSATLRKRIRAGKNVFVFPKADGGLYTKSAYRRLSERVLKAIDVQDATLYSFRHRRATDLYYLTQNGKVSTKKAAYLMGHSEVVFLKTYSHIDEALEDKNIYANFEFQAVRNL